MQALIDVFRMKELSVETRISVIKKLGVSINHQYAANITEPLVSELIEQLEQGVQSKNEINLSEVKEALAHAEVLINAINRSPRHEHKVCGEKVFQQSETWVNFAHQEVLPSINAAKKILDSLSVHQSQDAKKSHIKP